MLLNLLGFSRNARSRVTIDNHSACTLILSQILSFMFWIGVSKSILIYRIDWLQIVVWGLLLKLHQVLILNALRITHRQFLKHHLVIDELTLIGIDLILKISVVVEDGHLLLLVLRELLLIGWSTFVVLNNVVVESQLLKVLRVWRGSLLICCFNLGVLFSQGIPGILFGLLENDPNSISFKFILLSHVHQSFKAQV